jgi:type VI secretion system secreted protein VgrG
MMLSGERLPADASVRSFSAVEELSRPYRVRVELVTADCGLVLEGLLRSRALLSLADGAGRLRHFDGIISAAWVRGHDGRALGFAVEFGPALDLLGHREDSRIFQALSVVEVVGRVLADAGIADRIEWRLEHDYPKRDYLVQYRETDLDFIERLLEDEGMTYFFEHSPDGHTLVFADNPAAFRPLAGLDPVCFALVQGLAEATDPLPRFERELALRPSRVLLRDYDPVAPDLKPEAEAAVAAPVPIGCYEYPAGLRHGDGQGERRARVRLAELRAGADVGEGSSRAIGLCPGIPFRVAGASEPWIDGEYVARLVRWQGTRQPSASEQNVTCENRFEAIPAGLAYAPPRRTPRPRIRGLQTAIVTGPSSEQQAVHVDELGRIKVRMHWDRSGVGDDRSSCWLRVAQLGLGGSMILPRVGWEVAVAFADGDPDRPFCIGRLYNGKHPPLVALPGKATVGALKTLSTPGGAGSNRIGTDDHGGGQGLSLAGPKNVNTFAGGDKTETIGGNERHRITGNYGVTVGGADDWTVGGNQTINVGNALQTVTGGAQAITVGGSEEVGVEANYIEALGTRACNIGGNRITISNGVRSLVTGPYDRSVGAVQVHVAASAIEDGLATDYLETVGAVKAELVLGDSAENVGGDKLLTSKAAELHLVGSLSLSAATVDRHVGGLHLTKCGGSYQVSAPKIALVGGVGHFNGGGASLKLNGGPVIATGSAITIKSANIRKTAGTIKLD